MSDFCPDCGTEMEDMGTPDMILMVCPNCGRELEPDIREY